MTGGAISFMIDAFSRNKNINYTCVAHEQAAAMMADSYSRVGPNLSCTMSTSGPGATNLITGIACSWFDSIPSLHITGQVNSYEKQGAQKGTKNTRQIGFQETDIVSMTKPITKFSYQLKSPNEIKYVLEKACYLSQSGRPGPVLLDIPMNFQKALIDPKKLKSFKIPTKKNNLILLKQNIKKINNLLTTSKRPVLLIGGGIKISKSLKLLQNFIKKISIPVVTTWSGVDTIDHNNKNYIGNVGVYGSRAANFTVQNSDLLICLGSRLDTRITGGSPKTFGRNAKIIIVDIDKNELSKMRGLRAYLKICLNLNTFLKIFLLDNSTKRIIKKDWITKCLKWKKNYPIIKPDYLKQSQKTNPYIFVKELSKQLNKKSIVIADTGGHLTWLIQAIKIKFGQSVFSAFGNSPMGYALPAAIGASIQRKRKKIISINGDASIQINIQELQTIVTNKLPIKIIVFNNSGYGIIKQFQELYLNKRFEATIPKKGVLNPNFRKIAEAYGIRYNSIKKNSEIKKVLKKILTTSKPEFLEIFLKPNQKIIPKLQFGYPIEDLFPLLSRKELSENMITKPLSRRIKLVESN